MRNEQLFSDRIEAWKYGPVIPSLYQAAKRFGGRVIPQSPVSDAPVSEKSIETFLSSVVENYSEFSRIALSNLTHKSGTPWHQVYEPGVLNIKIPDDLIRQHYKQGFNARPSAGAIA